MFGVGSYRHRARGLGFEVDEDVYAPFGDDPVLLHDVVIRNTSRRTRRASWFEYWDVNPFDREHARAIAVREPRWSLRRRTLSARQLPGDGDNRPLTVFLAALRGPVRGHETSVADFFGKGTRAVPAAVAADRLGGSGHAAGTGRALFALRAPVRLRPGAAVRLRYVYGLAPGREVAPLVARLGRQRNPAAASARRWARWLPHADFGPRRRWVARELAWDAYLLRSATVYEAACGHHTVTQGGYYQYGFGQNLGSRSWLHYALPLVYTQPELAREILRYSISLQSRDSRRFNQLPYGTGSLCSRVDLGSSSDLDFWLLLAAGEYGLGARDPRFFDDRLPFYEGGSASAWRHLKIAFRHQESLRGPRGGYLAGEAGDWSDFSSDYLDMTETLLVPAQLAYAYPRLADARAAARRPSLRRDPAPPRRRAARVRRAPVDRPGLVRARLLGRPPDRQRSHLRGAAAVGGAGRRADTSPGQAARREHPALPDRDRGPRRTQPDRLGDLAGGRRPRRHGAPHRHGPARRRRPAGRGVAVPRRRVVRRERLAHLGAQPARRCRTARAALRVGRVHAQHAGGAHASLPQPLERHDLERRRLQRLLLPGARALRDRRSG